jgi:DNA-directed RNA polymerase subunit RPC12/RpoP
MTSPPREIEVDCPDCGRRYKDWYRPSINLGLDSFDADYLKMATTSTCPYCGHKVSHEVLIVRDDGVWEVGTAGGSSADDEKGWIGLRKPELGRVAELLFQVEFIKYGWEVYRPEVDRGVDIVAVSPEGRRFDVQVKGRRGLPYRVQIRRSQIEPRPDLLVSLAIFEGGFDPPHLFLIPSLTWLEERDDSLFSHGKSYWRINASRKNFDALISFEFRDILGELRKLQG